MRTELPQTAAEVAADAAVAPAPRTRTLPMHPQLVEEGKRYVWEHAQSALRRKERAVRVDPRYLAVVMDYLAWAEQELDSVAEEQLREAAAHAGALHEIRVARSAERARAQEALGHATKRLSVAHGLLADRPRWRFWAWRGWGRDVAAWLKVAS